MSVTINKKANTGEIKLSSGHSVILGHKPNIISAQQLSDQLKSDKNETIIESFGLWEVATPNYATYYPDVKPEDLNPEEADFINPVFRMLSEVIVGKNYRPIDFSKEGVLKKSMKMLLGQTINIDHEIAVGNAIGAVSEVYWQEAYKTKSGVEVPAGINAVLKIDGKSNPRIARGIMMNPPSIHSNSVTVRFKWAPSHTFEDMGRFWDLLGTYDDKGEMYRLVVTEILNYSETSIVSHGADPYAQKIKENGEIENPEYASRQSFSKDRFYKGNVEYDFKVDLKLSADDISIPLNSNNKEEINLNEENHMKKLIESLTLAFGFEAGELTEENITSKLQEKFDAKVDNTEALELLKKEKADLEAEKLTLKADLEKANSNKEAYETMLSEKRQEAERLYKLAKGEDADETLIKLIATGNLETTNAFLKQYEKEAEEKFSATCNSCGSKDVKRASAVIEDASNSGGKNNPTEKSKMETIQNLKDKKRKGSISLGKSSEK